MTMLDPDEKGKNVYVVIFYHKKLSFDAQFNGVSIGLLVMVLFSHFCVAYFGQKTNLKIFPLDIFETFGRLESHFRTA